MAQQPFGGNYGGNTPIQDANAATAANPPVGNPFLNPKKQARQLAMTQKKEANFAKQQANKQAKLENRQKTRQVNQRDFPASNQYNAPGSFPNSLDYGAPVPGEISYNDPNRFSNTQPYGGTGPGIPYPIFGAGPTGDMPTVQRAFSSGGPHTGITQLLPNLYQSNQVQSQPNQFGLSDTNVGPIESSQLSRVTTGSKGFSPEDALNIAREGENQLASDNAHRQAQAQSFLSGSQNNVRDLYGQALDATNAIGQQARGRIGEQLQSNLSSSSSDLAARGLGNSTITDTVGHLYRREADDANLGVDQMQAQAKMGVLGSLAGSEQQYGSEQSSIYGQNGQLDPAMYLLPGQTAGAAPRQQFNWGSLAGPLLGAVGSIFGGPIGGALAGGAGAAGNAALQQQQQQQQASAYGMGGADPAYG